MPPEVFIDQHPDALRLTLVEGSLDHSKFQLLASDSCEALELTIQATVIGASHIIRFGWGPFVLHEVFACVGLEDVASWTLERLVDSSVKRQLPGMYYQFSAFDIPWQDPEPPELVTFVSEAHRRADEQRAIGVVQDFPSGDCAAIPKTVIVGYPDVPQNGFVIRTAHSYPNVKKLVMSYSSLCYV